MRTSEAPSPAELEAYSLDPYRESRCDFAQSLNDRLSTELRVKLCFTQYSASGPHYFIVELRGFVPTMGS